MSIKIVQFVKLHTGAKMPLLGLGTYETKTDDMKIAVDCALKVGYRHIDTAKRYDNETDIGQVVKENIDKGLIKRSDLFLTTKIAATHLGCEKDILNCALESLQDLQTTYVDMLLIHYPFGYESVKHGGEEVSRNLKHYDLVTAWSTMEKLVRDGHARAIGLSNFNRFQIHRIWENVKIKPSNVQMECHAYYQQRALREFCQARGIIVTAYAPLGAPAKPKRQFDSITDSKVLLDDPVVQDIADKIQKSPGQVLLRYLLQLGVVVIPKSTTVSRIQDNYTVFDFSLDSVNMNKLRTLDCGFKYYKFPWATKHPEYNEKEPY